MLNKIKSFFNNDSKNNTNITNSSKVLVSNYNSQNSLNQKNSKTIKNKLVSFNSKNGNNNLNKKKSFSTERSNDSTKVNLQIFQKSDGLNLKSNKIASQPLSTNIYQEDESLLSDLIQINETIDQQNFNNIMKDKFNENGSNINFEISEISDIQINDINKKIKTNEKDEVKSKKIEDIHKYYTPDIKEKKFEISPFFQWNINDFDIGNRIGRGKFGRVYLTREKKSGCIVALKVVNKNDIIKYKLVHQLRREIEIQSHLDHPNILKLLGVFWNEKQIFLILEYCPGGEVFRELTRSVIFLHSLDVNFQNQRLVIICYKCVTLLNIYILNIVYIETSNLKIF